MPTEQDHLQCANRTQKTILHLLADKAVHSPWIAVTAFYKALHIVEAVFATSGTHSPNHFERACKLKERKFQKIAEHYFPLERAGVNARYLAEHGTFDAYMTPDQVIAELLKHHLRQVEVSAKKSLKQADLLVEIGSAFPEPNP